MIKGNPRRFEVEKYYAPHSPIDTDWMEKSRDIIVCIINWMEENVRVPIDLAIEEPFAIPGKSRMGAFAIQNRFLGMLYCSLRYNHKPGIGSVLLVHPGTAKRVLAGNGRAQKPAMVQAARKFTKLPARQAAKEAVADAVGIGMAAWKLHIDGVSAYEA